MVKKRHPVPIVPFAHGPATRLGLEVLTVRGLIAREVLHDLTRPQRPTFHHFFLVTDGPGSHTVDFTRHRLKRGDVLFAAGGQVQQFSLDRRLDAQMIVFEPDFLTRSLARGSAPLHLAGARLATARALFEATAREHAAFDGSPGSAALLSALVEAIAAAFAPAPAAGKSLQARFEAALETSFHRAREVAAYAAILNCSPRTLARVCERASGSSAKELIDQRVLLEARRLLAHGSESAAQVSAQLGFAEPTQFGKFFRRLTGETPAEFRGRFEGGVVTSVAAPSAERRPR